MAAKIRKGRWLYEGILLDFLHYLGVQAKGKADAAIIEAEGQSQANTKLQQSLSDNVIRQHAIEKWNGELP